MLFKKIRIELLKEFVYTIYGDTYIFFIKRSLYAFQMVVLILHLFA